MSGCTDAKVAWRLNLACRRLQMRVVVRRIGGRRLLVRGAAIVVLTSGVAACSSIQNMIPDPGNFRLPDRSVFLPANANFAQPVSANGPVRPADLVDGQGQCAGAPEASDAASAQPR